MTSSIVSSQSLVVLFLHKLSDHVTCEPKQKERELEFAVKISWVRVFTRISSNFQTWRLFSYSKHGSYLP